MKRMAWTAVCGMAVVGVTGCTTVQQSFPDRHAGQVWTALVAAAESPDYDDPDYTKRWTLKENVVHVDEATARIEVYRELDRVLRRPGSRPLRQHRTWRFRIVMEAIEPPAATFVSRGFAIPTHAAAEGDRYFEDVWSFLEETRPIEPSGAVDAMPLGPADTTEPAVDIDALEP